MCGCTVAKSGFIQELKTKNITKFSHVREPQGAISVRELR